MNWPYIHLLTNHFPIILAVLGAGAAVAALAIRRRAVWLYALATLALAGASAYPTKFVGGLGARMLEHAPGLDQRAVLAHHDASERATVALMLVGALAAYGWWRMTRQRVALDPALASPSIPGAVPLPADGPVLPLWLRAAVVAGSLAAAGLITYASYLGGHVLHGANALTSPPSLVAPGLVPSDAPAPGARRP